MNLFMIGLLLTLVVALGIPLVILVIAGITAGGMTTVLTIAGVIGFVILIGAAT